MSGEKLLPENAAFLAFWYDEETQEICVQLPLKQGWMSYAQFARLGYDCYKLAADFKHTTAADAYINKQIHATASLPMHPDEEVNA